jgi:dipeptidyl-peptidase-3
VDPAPPAGAAPAPQPARPYLLERVGDTAVVQLYADGFAHLPRDAKILAFHLAQAAIAGRDIFLDQKYEHALAMREWCEELFVHRAALAPAARAEVERYTKYFWLNNGPHHHDSSRKEGLRLTREELGAAIAAAEADGAKFPWDPSRTRDETQQWLVEVAFNPEVDPICTNKSPGAGKDILAASGVNFYRGVTMEDLDAFAERYALNSRVVKRADGTIVEEVWRCGDGGKIPPGRYAKEIGRIVGHLLDAMPFAPAATRRALECLVRAYQTGEESDWRQYHISWVADRDGLVDTVNGFVEVYNDPRGVKGSFEGIVSYVNQQKTEAIRKLAAEASWFEARMPWDDRYKKTDVRGITANAIDVVIETGDGGPFTPIGINLPNPQDIREEYGSKSVQLSNVAEAFEKSLIPALRREFCNDDAEFQRATKLGMIASEVHTNMHEVIGHASGRQAEHAGDPAKSLREFYSTLEEARSDLVALWFIGDRETIARGMSPGSEAALAEYEGYTRGSLLVQLRRFPRGDQIEEDHARNRQLIAKWILENSNAITKKTVGGKTYFAVRDAEEWRRAAGRLLAEVMRIKGEGDFAAGKRLVETYGVKFDPRLRDEVFERVRVIDPPSYTGFVQPRLTAARDAHGGILDIKIDYPRDLATQMLEWSGRLRPAG